MDRVRVLLVEDDEDDYLLTRDLLAEIDGGGRYTLDWARTYEAALEMLSRGSHDVCLLDHRLGARTGIELLREARADGHASPMILLTGLADPELDLEAMRAGAADYLVKGQLSAALLERSIRYALAHRRSERERIELAREQAARAEAEAANRAKDEFLALVSHELRTPLNAILGWAQLIAKSARDPEAVSKAAATIERNALIQRQLIEDLLDLARITGGKLRLDVRPLDMTAVVEAALDVVRPAAAAKSIELRASLDPAAGQVTGDPGRLRQVVWNLVSNAIKFTPEGGRVEVELGREGPNVKVEVRDTGRGISPDFMPYLFERFRQADTASGRRHGGLGLGLALVRHLVEAHGGTVGAESAGEGRGATFTVRLSVRAVRGPEAEARPPEAPGPDLAGVRVLVVEDEPDAREMVAVLLRHYGAEVRVAGSAAEAWGQLSAGELPDVLISDLSMPEEDGYALIARVRALPAGGQIPAVALTAHARAEDRQRALAAGFQEHLAKPVDPDELIRTVAGLTARRA